MFALVRLDPRWQLDLSLVYAKHVSFDFVQVLDGSDCHSTLTVFSHFVRQLSASPLGVPWLVFSV
jgi:hypothetical protein